VGGATGEVLAKASGTDYDTEWVARNPFDQELNTGSTPSFQILTLGDGGSYADDEIILTTGLSIGSGVTFSDNTLQSTALPSGLADGYIVSWDEDTATYLSVPNDARTLFITARNITGTTIPKGSVVLITGASGNRPTIGLAQGDTSANADGVIGITDAAIDNNANGRVITEGLADNLDTSAFAAGDKLYLSATTPGGLVNVRPVQPAHSVAVGVVTRSNNAVGSIEVKIQVGEHLEFLHDVLLTSKANGDFLVYESATSLWKNRTLASLDLLTATAAASVYQPLSGMGSYLTTSAAASTYYPLTGNPSGFLVSGDLSGYLLSSTAATTYAAKASTNTFTASQVIEVTDNSTAALRVTQLGTGEAFRVEDAANPDSTPFVINADGRVGIAGNIDAAYSLKVQGGSGVGGIRTDGFVLIDGESAGLPRLTITQNGNGGGAIITNSGTGASFRVNDEAADTTPFIVDAGGNVGVKTASPSTDFEVAGNAKFTTGNITTAPAAADSSSLIPTTAWVQAEVPAASTTAAGKVELATDAEAVAGTSSTLAVTPKGLSDTIAAQRVDIQSFGSSTTSGTFTWTKPAGAKLVQLRLLGAGGGGAGGACALVANARNGSGGGGGGPSGYFLIPASELDSTVTVVVGAGGAGGAGRDTTGTASAGSNGSPTSFGKYRVFNGNASTGLSGGAGFAGTLFQIANSTSSGSGGAGQAGTGTAGVGFTSGQFIGTGGGGGGGAAAGVTTASPGGAGGSRTNGTVPSSYTDVLAGGAAGTAGGNGTNGTDQDVPFAGGTGGGGGSYATAQATGNGGNGGWPSGGGGGGAASDNTFMSGTGGNGANGAVIVITYF
jgi:hypothetical protein